MILDTPINYAGQVVVSRIAATFASLQAKHKKALIPFITAGDPEPAVTVPLLHAMAAAGADIIELGVPFSDPMADGPVIQRSSERALKHNTSLVGVLSMVKDFRERNNTTPIILMGYANPIEVMGCSSFAEEAGRCGVDGVITVDYPPEESQEYVKCLVSANIDPIFLFSPTTHTARIKTILQVARGFLYYVSLKGVTGSANLDLGALNSRLTELRALSTLPLGVGFGIRDAETAQAVAKIADAVIVGSRIVQEIESSKRDDLLANIQKLIRSLREGIDQA